MKHFYKVFHSFKQDLLKRYPVHWDTYMSERKYLETSPPDAFNRGGWKCKWNCKETRKRKRTIDLDPDNEVGNYFAKDLIVGRISLVRYMSSSYMKWDGGSSFLFWRWPESSRMIARDGIPPYILTLCLLTNQRPDLSLQNIKN